MKQLEEELNSAQPGASRRKAARRLGVARKHVHLTSTTSLARISFAAPSHPG